MADQENRCTATSKRTGERCRRYCRPGSWVCAYHGARAPQVIAAADRRAEVMRVESDARREAGLRGSMTLPEVYQELLNTAALAVAWRDEMQQRVDRLKEIRYKSVIGTEQTRAEVALLERGMTRAAKVLELIARLDIESRARNLSEAQGALVVGVIQRILDGLNLTPDQQALVPVVVPRELRRMAEGR